MGEGKRERLLKETPSSVLLVYVMQEDPDIIMPFINIICAQVIVLAYFAYYKHTLKENFK